VPQDGQTLLHAACINGKLEMVEALLAKGADVQAKANVSIARARALCLSRSHAHMQNAHPLGDVPVCLSLETAPRLQGLSAIANARLGQSGSGQQRDTVHH
jgi:ankyrin repeat protein